MFGASHNGAEETTGAQGRVNWNCAASPSLTKVFTIDCPSGIGPLLALLRLQRRVLKSVPDCSGGTNWQKQAGLDERCPAAQRTQDNTRAGDALLSFGRPQ